MTKYTKINRQAINRWCKKGWRASTPISENTFKLALKGNKKLKITPTKYIPEYWIENIAFKKVLGIAAGGAQQMPILAALKADCTVMDFSFEQIEKEKQFAQAHNYKIKTVIADMSEKLPFADESFNVIVNPISNHYIKNIQHLWNECYRVLKKDGILIASFDNGLNYMVDQSELMIVNKLPFDPLSDANLYDQMLKNDMGIQFSHTLQEQLQGQIKAGFQILDLYEDTNGQGRLHALNINTFMATYAIKK